MSIRFFADNTPNADDKFVVLQEDSETEKPFGVKEFDTLEEARIAADDMQKAFDKASSERTTGELPEIGEVSNTADESEFKDTPQDLKDETSQE